MFKHRPKWTIKHFVLAYNILIKADFQVKINNLLSLQCKEQHT